METYTYQFTDEERIVVIEALLSYRSKLIHNDETAKRLKK